MRRHQQAQQHEHHDLRQPGRGIEEGHHRIMRAGRPVADDDAGKIDREEAGGVHHLRGGEDHQRRGGDERRMQALRQRDAVERDHHRAAADDPDDPPEHGFLQQFPQDMPGRAVADRDELDQHQGQEHRKRIVAAGFGFQCRANSRAQAQALRVHQQEHRGRVGRGHDGADQKRFGPVEVERIARDRRSDDSGQQHADRGEHHRGRKHGADVLEARAQAAVEQDQRQCDRADEIGAAHVVELQPAGSGIARQHADDEEHQQQGGAEAQREQAREDARHDEHGTQQDRDTDLVERSHAKITEKTLPFHPYRRYH